MRRLTSLFTYIFVFSILSVSAQDQSDPVLLTVDGDEITVSEFEAVYKKNNKSVDNQSLEEYLELFIKFRLKVHDAENRGMDTLERFRKELEGYRRQLAEPYLSDNEVTEELIKEAYERIQVEIDASHIMVKIDPAETPADTLKAYQKIAAIKKKVDNGADFAATARSESDDPSAVENGGNLGYFSALFMVYPFESEAYKTEVGKVSNIVRTQFGYHIIKVNDKRPNRGEITVAHIMTRIPKEANEADIESARMKIYEIHDKLLEGGNWDELSAQYSEDKTTAKRGGKLPSFTSGRMVPEFEDASFRLEKDGDISKPIQTQFGFHIIKRLNLKEIGTFEEMAPELKQKIQRDGRSKLSKQSFIKKVKEEYGFTQNLNRRNDFYKVLDDSFFEQKWSAESAKNLNKQLFKLGDTIINQSDFAAFLESNQPRKKGAELNVYVDQLYDAYVQQVCIMYEDDRLMKKYPEFKLLMQEYHDGILLFDLTDEMVWSKAVKDTSGLEKFYEEHKSENMWGDRLDVDIYSCASADVAKSVLKLVKSKEKKGLTNDDIKKEVNEESQLNLEIISGKFGKEDMAVLEKIEWTIGIKSKIESEGRHFVIDVKNVLGPEPKQLNEVKGLMTSAYQNYLEVEWIKELRNKYPVEVHEEHLKLIK